MQPWHWLVGCITAILLGWPEISFASNPIDAQLNRFFSRGGHTNNWAVLVCTSRYWFNYRHIANTLSMYRTVKRLGIPDSNIILMLADDVACNARNAYPGTVYNHFNRQLELVGQNIEVDYRGYDVTVENFIRLLTGRHTSEVPRSKRLLTDDRSNILVFMTGHGGDDFLKFQDAEEIGGQDIADAIAQMREKQRYHEILFMADTCQANTLYERIYSPNVLAVGSSRRGESSYSHHYDADIGVAVIDRFTHATLQFMESVYSSSNDTTLQQYFDSFDPVALNSHPGNRTDLFHRSLDQVPITDFFGGIQGVEITRESYPISRAGDMELASKPEASTVKEGRSMDHAKASTATQLPRITIAPPALLQTGSLLYPMSVLVGAVTGGAAVYSVLSVLTNVS